MFFLSHLRSVYKNALEARAGVKVPSAHDIAPWNFIHAGVLLNRCDVSQDGKTVHERLCGREPKVLGLEMG